VPAYLTAVAEGRFTDALEIVMERNPLPSVCGRACLRPCEEGCRRCHLDEPVAIAQLKRAAADFGAYPAAKVDRPRPESIAVVGSGPAGLTAAHDLAQRGFQVTIYEGKHRLGGMLRYGIPNYRLPDAALDKDINYILSLGVKVVLDTRVGTDVMLDALRERYDAVVVTAGLQGSRALPIPGTHHDNVLAALPFLEEAANGRKAAIGNSVVVIGGGNVAIDVARTARRMGAKAVRVICLENADEMPASKHEIEEARLEGVRVECSWGPREVLGEKNVCGLKAVRCTSVFDADKRFAPTFDEDTVEQFDADTVIFATGQSADVADLGVELTPRGAIACDPLTLKTSAERVYAAGDVVSGPSRIIDAISAGHRVAACVVRDLTGNAADLAALDEENATLGKVPEAMKSKLETRRRIQMEKLEFYEAVNSFAEIEYGYTEYEAAREAQRCLGCTTGARLAREKCAACLTCMRVCPHHAPAVKIGGYLYFDAEACHACGACASQCPAQAISLEGHSEEEMTARVARLLNNPGLDTTIEFDCGGAPFVARAVDGDVRSLKVTCLLRASERTVLEALRSGAHRVVFAGCVESTCRYPHARVLVQQRMDRIRNTLAEIGLADSFIVAGEAEEQDVHLR
jgi:NADPH-dependent glutamate synthase beta subunit-like oxidoreductase